MTGYASVQQTGAGAASDAPLHGPGARRLGLEIRAVNGRFLDLSFRLPDELREHEPALRELLNAQLKRGKIELRAVFDPTGGAALSTPAPRLLQQLGPMQDAVRAWLPDAQPLTVADVLRLCAADERGGRGLPWDALQPLVQQLVQALLESRAREGARLASMLLDCVAQLRALCDRARPLAPQLAQQQRERFLERWNDALALTRGGGEAAATPLPPDAAHERALTEATAFAIRIDVAEELTRLASHLDEVERLLGAGGAVGKRLEFLIQELQREANTLGSKSAALELTRIALDMKVLVEQMREQVQNVE